VVEGLGTAEPGQLHELLEGKAALVRRHELLVDLLRKLLRQVLRRTHGRTSANLPRPL